MGRKVRKVAIIGAGDGGRLILNMLRAFYKDISPAGFIDDNRRLSGKDIDGLKVVGGLEQLTNMDIDAVLMGIGCSNMSGRASVFMRVKKIGLEFLNLLHPRSMVDDSVSLGEGVIIFAGVVVNSFTHIRDNVVIFPGATIDHDCAVGNNVYISPGVNVAGHVNIKEGAFIGIGAKIIDRINIGRYVTVGAGAVVLNDIPDKAVCVGVPARVLRIKKKG